MAKYKALQSFPMSHPDNPKRQVLVRGGDVIELDDDFVQGGVEAGTLEPLDQPEDGSNDEGDEDIELPTRPSNGGTKEAWRAYLAELSKVTSENSDLEPLQVPDTATRDEMIAIGDARVAEWNEE
jgi:hypothetical protein